MHSTHMHASAEKIRKLRIFVDLHLQFHQGESGFERTKQTIDYHAQPSGYGLDLQTYLHVQWLRFQHVSAYSLRKTSGNTKD